MPLLGADPNLVKSMKKYKSNNNIHFRASDELVAFLDFLTTKYGKNNSYHIKRMITFFMIKEGFHFEHSETN